MPEVCKLKAQSSRQKRGLFLIFTFSFELSAKIATSSTPDPWNRSKENPKIRIAESSNIGYALTTLAFPKDSGRRRPRRQRFYRFIEPISVGQVRARRSSRSGGHCSGAWADSLPTS